MNLQAIQMPRDEAKAALLAYRAAVKERHDAEYEACVRGYQALERGHKIISLQGTIRAGGTNEEGCPRLAVARADDREVTFYRRENGSVQFGPTRWHAWKLRKH